MQLLLQVLNKEPNANGIATDVAVDVAVPEEGDIPFADIVALPENDETSVLPNPKTDGVAKDVPPARGQEFAGPDVAPSRAALTVTLATVEAGTDPIPVPQTSTVKVPSDPVSTTAPVMPTASAVPSQPIETRAKIDEPLKGPTPGVQGPREMPVLAPAPEKTLMPPISVENMTSPTRPAVDPQVPDQAKPANVPLAPEKPIELKQAERPSLEEMPVKGRGARPEARIDVPFARPDPAVAKSTPAQPVAEVQLRSKVAPTPIEPRGLPVVPELARPQVAPKETGLLSPAVAAPAPAQYTPVSVVTVPNAPPTPKPARSARSEAAPEVTITLTSAPAVAKTSEPMQSTVAMPVFAKDQVARGVPFVSELVAPKDEALPPLTTQNAADARRSPDAAPQRIEAAARPVLTQLVQAARSAIDGVIEVKLSPEELGRVRLAMTTMESGMTVLVTAERAETLDLLRRNIDLFAADLAEQGFNDLSFTFGDEAAQGDDAQRDNDGPLAGEQAAKDQQMMRESRVDVSKITPDGRVDLRL